MLVKLLFLLWVVGVYVGAATPQMRPPCGPGHWRDIFGQCQKFTIGNTGGSLSSGLEPYKPCGPGNWRDVNGQCQRFTIGVAKRAISRRPCGPGYWRDVTGQCQRFTITTGETQPGSGLQAYKPCGPGNWRDVNGQCQRFTITRKRTQRHAQVTHTYPPCGLGRYRDTYGKCQPLLTLDRTRRWAQSESSPFSKPEESNRSKRYANIDGNTYHTYNNHAHSHFQSSSHYPGSKPFVHTVEYHTSHKPQSFPHAYPHNPHGYPHKPHVYPLNPHGYPLNPHGYPLNPHGYPQNHPHQQDTHPEEETAKEEENAIPEDWIR